VRARAAPAETLKLLALTVGSIQGGAANAAGYPRGHMHRLPPLIPTSMRYSFLVLALPLLTACVSIDLPGVVSDTAKVAKDTYRSVSGKKDEHEGARTATESAFDSVSNTYVGQDSQTAAEVRQLCVNEAAGKLFKASGKEVPYTVTENMISTVNNTLAAHCKATASKVTASKVAQTPPTGKP
jgi:hypothetical protein